MYAKAWISLCILGHSAWILGQTTELTSSKTLPPPPTGSACKPHGDHWHCHTTLTGSADTHSATGSCEPHGDHLHCPSGVAKPTTPPAQTGAKSTGHDDHVSATGKACTPHNDHWHCPSGVSAPTYAPTAAQASGSSDGGSVAAATSALSGASRREGVVATGVLAAVLLAALLL